MRTSFLKLFERLIFGDFLSHLGENEVLSKFWIKISDTVMKHS